MESMYSDCILTIQLTYECIDGSLRYIAHPSSFMQKNNMLGLKRNG